MSAISGQPPAGAQAPRGDRAAGFALLRRIAGNSVVRVIVRRLVMAVPLLFIVTATSFVLVALTPGDAARAILGIEATQQEYDNLRKVLGLDEPLPEQYWHWLTNAVHGDFGRSVTSGEVVTDVISARLPVTLSLIIGALLVITFLGVAVGVFSAVRGGVAARAVDALALIGFAMPSFWLGALLISLFAVKIRWFPATGYVSLADSPRDWILSLALPVAALGLHSVAAIAKQTREAMLDALASDYVRMAWATGISPRSIVFRHALRNASIRVLTILGLLFVGLLGGTVFVEYVFALPGLGGLAVQAATQHDLPTMQALVVYFTVIVVIVNLVIDTAYTWANPRVRAQ